MSDRERAMHIERQRERCTSSDRGVQRAMGSGEERATESATELRRRKLPQGRLQFLLCICAHTHTHTAITSGLSRLTLDIPLQRSSLTLRDLFVGFFRYYRFPVASSPDADDDTCDVSTALPPLPTPEFPVKHFNVATDVAMVRLGTVESKVQRWKSGAKK